MIDKHFDNLYVTQLSSIMQWAHTSIINNIWQASVDIKKEFDAFSTIVDDSVVQRKETVRVCLIRITVLFVEKFLQVFHVADRARHVQSRQLFQPIKTFLMSRTNKTCNRFKQVIL